MTDDPELKWSCLSETTKEISISIKAAHIDLALQRFKIKMKTNRSLWLP